MDVKERNNQFNKIKMHEKYYKSQLGRDFKKVGAAPRNATVVTNIKRNDCRLLHRAISISQKERRRKLFRLNLVTTVNKIVYKNERRIEF